MKRLFPLLLLFFYSEASSSDSLPKKRVIYKMHITNLSDKNISGFLKNIDDEDIVYTSTPERFGSFIRPADKTISYNDVATVQLKRKGSVGRGALYGSLIGFATGAIIGLIEGDDKLAPYSGDPLSDIFIGIGNAFAMTAGEKAIMYGISIGGAGAIAGAVIGAAARKKFTIGGNKEKFYKMKTDVLQRAYGKTTQSTDQLRTP